MIIIKNDGLKFNNGAVTGDCDVTINFDTVQPENILEASNVAYCSSSCTSGSGSAICIRTGEKTVAGMIFTPATEETD